MGQKRFDRSRVAESQSCAKGVIAKYVATGGELQEGLIVKLS
jgi:hypothetical protein